LTNFNASLEIRHIRNGGTSKADDLQQTGQFGEGLCVAALVFLRKGHSVQIKSSGFSWNFGLDEKAGEMFCILKRLERNTTSSLEADPFKDVAVYIAFQSKKPKIRQVDYDSWMNEILDMNPPTDIKETDYGDLILDKGFENCFYYQGLRLSGGSSRGLPHSYGYNFISGELGRERRYIEDPKQELGSVFNIWGAAIEEDPGLVAKYTELLLEKVNMTGDVMLAGFNITLKMQTAAKVWVHMLTINRDGEGRKPFYYDAARSKLVSGNTRTLSHHGRA